VRAILRFSDSLENAQLVCAAAGTRQHHRNCRASRSARGP
jgi:hypothetical protein